MPPAEGFPVLLREVASQLLYTIKRRTFVTISHLNSQGTITIHTDTGKRVEFDLHQHPHLDYGYAMTSHSSQGQTTDRVLVHVDTEQGAQLVNSRMAYVAVSRARYDAQIYTDNKEELGDQLARQHSHSTALESVQEHHQNHGQGVETEVEPSMVAQEIDQAEELNQADSALSHGKDEGISQGFGE